MEKSAVQENNTALSGMVAIRDFCRSINLASSEASVIQFIQQYSFPAKKLGGIWESDRDKIKEWRKQYVSGGIEIEQKPDNSGNNHVTSATATKKQGKK